MFLFEKVEQEPESQTMTGATMTVKLDENADYSMLILRFSWTADSSQVDHTKYRIADWLTSITVVGDDDKYIINASARELMALHFYRTKRPATEYCNSLDDSVNTLELPIYFGRSFGDKKFFLAKKQFSKLELNVTNGDSATGNFFDAGTLEVRSYQFKDHALTPEGVMRTKQVKDWTPPTATASHTEKLPDKHKIEKLLITCIPTYTAITAALTSEMDTLIDKLKLTFMGGDRVVFDDDAKALMERNALVYGMAVTIGHIDGQEGDYWDSGLGYRMYAGGITAQDPSAADLQLAIILGTTQKVALAAQGVAADNDYSLTATGLAYMDSLIFDFAPKDDLEDLYDPAMYAKGELKITAGSVSGSIQLVVCEIVTAF